eukprot:gene5651-11401_t
MADAPPKSRKPEDTPFKQQKLKAWQPILTPNKVIAIFLTIGVIFVPVGVKLFQDSSSLYESTISYDGYRSKGSCSIGRANEGKICFVTFTMTRDVTGPLYVYYELENFYQNHRRYVKSRSSSQLMGLEEVAPKTACDPLAYNGSQLLYPCGLIANSFFNDRKVKFKQIEGFKKAPKGNKDCSVVLGVSAADAKETFYQNQIWCFYYPKDATTQYLYESFPQVINPIEGVENEHFIVWMRTAGLPTFRKLYGKINSNFKKDEEVRFAIENNFEVSSFDGKKSLVLSTIGSFGGKNSFIGIAYIVVGSVCLLLTVLFGLKQIFFPRELGDTRYLGWSS